MTAALWELRIIISFIFPCMKELVHYAWDNYRDKPMRLGWIWHERGNCLYNAFIFFHFSLEIFQFHQYPYNYNINLVDWRCNFGFASAVTIVDWVLNWGHSLLALWYQPQILLIILWSRCYSESSSCCTLAWLVDITRSPEINYFFFFPFPSLLYINRS